MIDPSTFLVTIHVRVWSMTVVGAIPYLTACLKEEVEASVDIGVDHHQKNISERLDPY